MDVDGGGRSEGFPITALRETNILLALNHENIVSVREMVVEPLPDADGSFKAWVDFLERASSAHLAISIDPFYELGKRPTSARSTERNSRPFAYSFHGVASVCPIYALMGSDRLRKRCAR